MVIPLPLTSQLHAGQTVASRFRLILPGAAPLHACQEQSPFGRKSKARNLATTNCFFAMNVVPKSLHSNMVARDDGQCTRQVFINLPRGGRTSASASSLPLTQLGTEHGRTGRPHTHTRGSSSLQCDPAGYRVRFFGKYSRSCELCFGSRYIGRLAGS